MIEALRSLQARLSMNPVQDKKRSQADIEAQKAEERFARDQLMIAESEGMTVRTYGFRGNTVYGPVAVS